MHYLLSIYFSNKPLHASSRFTAHHQEILHCIYSSWYISCVYVDWLLARFRSKPIKTFTCLFQNCSWDLTGLLPYSVDCRYVTPTLTPTKYVKCEVPECTSNCIFLSCTSNCLYFSPLFVRIHSVKTYVTTFM
jgi:hypothetical protein